MISISKNVFIDKLDDIVNKYNNRYHRTNQMKPVDLKPGMYIKLNTDKNKEGPKFKVSSHVRISKDKNIFAKGYYPNWTKEVLLLKKLKTLCHEHTLLVILAVRKLLKGFTKKNCEKRNQKSLEMKKYKGKRRQTIC